MSFILDALKKSETDRQQRGAAEFAGVPSSSGRREGPPVWLWVVAALLLVNLAVLIGVLLRPEVTTVEPVVTQGAEPEPRTMDDFASKVETARQNAPPREEPAMVAEKPPEAAVQKTAADIARPPTSTVSLPTVQQLQADGTLALPELHVDIHVYSDVAKDRFVFINMVKHNEGSRLAEGPLVEEITPDGVVLSHDGTTFLLPRD